MFRTIEKWEVNAEHVYSRWPEGREGLVGMAGFIGDWMSKVLSVDIPRSESKYAPVTPSASPTTHPA